MNKWFVFLVGAMINFGAMCFSSFTFVATVRPTFAADLIVLVKEISIGEKKHLIVFDRKARGQVFDVENNYALVMNLVTSCSNEFCMSDIFYYQDQDQERLLIGYNGIYGYLCVYNLDKPLYSGMTTAKRLFVGHRFSLAQLTDRSFVVENTRDKSSYIIPGLWWDDIHNRCIEAYHKVIFEKKEILAAVDVIKEGIVAEHRKIQYDQCPRLREDSLDLTSIPAAQKRSLVSTDVVIAFNEKGDVVGNCTRSYLPIIDCYHTTPEGITYCGHDGIVSVWREQ